MSEYHQSSGGRRTAVTGDLQKLTFHIGSLLKSLSWQCCVSKHKFHVVSPTRWKGQLPKRVAIKRIQKILMKPNCGVIVESIPEILTDHEWDAIGLGLFLLGMLKW